MKTGEDVQKEMCRYIDAAKNRGFDGKEHPEYLKIVDVLFGGPLYPLTAEDVAALQNGKARLVYKEV